MGKSSASNEFIHRIIENYSDMLIRIAYHNTKNMADAEDIVQEVLLKAFRLKADDSKVIETDGHLKAWLIRVTINKCRDMTRTVWFKKTTALNELTSEKLSFTYDEDETINEILKLPTKYRNVIFLYYYEGYSIAEIANIMHSNQNTISSQLQRARQQLKQELLQSFCECET